MARTAYPHSPLSVIHSYLPPSDPSSASTSVDLPGPTDDEIAQILQQLEATLNKPSLLATDDSEFAALQREEAELDRKLANLPPAPPGLEKLAEAVEATHKKVTDGQRSLNQARSSQSKKLKTSRDLSKLLILETCKRMQTVSEVRGCGPVPPPDIDALIAKGFENPGDTLTEFENYLKSQAVLKRKKKPGAK
jgi:hypothetical protein